MKTSSSNNPNKSVSSNESLLNMDFRGFLTPDNKFEDVNLISDPFTSKLVKIKNSDYSGLVEYVFELHKFKFIAMKISQNKQLERTIDVDIFGKKFKGFIAKYDCFELLPNGDYCMKDSKIIDKKQIYYFEAIKEEDQMFIEIKNSSPMIYGKVLRRVKINKLDAMECTKIIFSHENDNLFHVKNADVKLIEDWKPVNKYHNQVIIIPDSILKIEKIDRYNFNINDLVRFKDVSSASYQGKVGWTGKINEDPAAVILLNENCWTEDILPFRINKNLMKEYFQFDKPGVCVGQFVLIPDFVSYITCIKTNLDVVDPKFKYKFDGKEVTEKCLIFRFENKTHAVTLKWKGNIYNQNTIGCEMSNESEQGSNGIYGGDSLFKCSLKKGIMITAEKVNTQNINLCEFGSHADIKIILTKSGLKFYDINSICCIEHLDRISDKPELKLGCKIMYDNQYIGICKFIGKVNCKPSVGVEIVPKFVNESASVLDCINDFAFKVGRFEFLDVETINIGSYYTKDTSIESSLEGVDIGSNVCYYPKNNINSTYYCATLKWLGKHNNGNSVCGIELEDEIQPEMSNYFFESLFQHKENRGIIDDIHTIKCQSSEINNVYTESCCTLTSGNIELLKEKIIKGFLKKRSDIDIMEILDYLIELYPTELMNILNDEDDNLIKVDQLPLIFASLYNKDKIVEMIMLINKLKDVNNIFDRFLELLSNCIDTDKLDIVSCILAKLSEPINNEANNSACLQLAIKCLENMKNYDSKNDRKKSLFKSLIEKCSDVKCLIVKTYGEKETFITDIILNKNIAENIVVDVLKMKNFDINQQNSYKKTPMELAIDNCKVDILKELFDLNCIQDTLSSILYKLLDSFDSTKKDVITLINKQLLNKTKK